MAQNLAVLPDRPSNRQDSILGTKQFGFAGSFLLFVFTLELFLPLPNLVPLSIRQARGPVLDQYFPLGIFDHGIQHIGLGTQHREILFGGLEVVEEQGGSRVGADNVGQRHKLALSDPTLGKGFVDDERHTDRQQYQSAGQQHDRH